ncbi:hypothetical protein BDZ90DRAFT_216871 [Jaminaea rosea]|uniref:MFS general substrate transporter n=1 Tax=Jaminaea rosea TaxID=1569628 RepID=A0A316UZR7_9BASI|nr:hypothetical protein BDZ90DRAFT_216871 [Jaminaea rosea]PWN29801.1 hypothetical protein BDZ90DRAFT_216871 [Jaminaea rosea]
MGRRLARYYANPYTQVSIIGLTAFCCPGMFNALSGMGGGGQVDPQPADKANIALYSTFAVVSFFAGSIHNKLGTRLTLWLGSLGYVVYIAAFLSYNFNQNGGFIVFAGALLGVCASLFWSAQGAVMLSYPTEATKGRAIAIFWTIFNLGAVIGAAVAMGLSWNSPEGSSLGNGTYAAFVAITFIGGLISALLKNPATIVRADGSSVVVPKSTTWRFELVGLYRLLRTDTWILLLFPAFFATNFFYTWQFNVYNARLFTLRTRALNSLLYWLAQIVGSVMLTLVVDRRSLARKMRAWIGWFITLAIVFAVWGGSYAEQLKFSRNEVIERIDVMQSSAYVGLCFLYLFSGIMDSIFQCFTYWLIGALSDDLSKLAIMAGLYKSLQSAGAATAFGLDHAEQPFMVILGVSWALCAVGLLLAVPVIALRVTEHTDPLSEKTAPGRELEVQAATEQGLARTGVVPEALRGGGSETGETVATEDERREKV